MAVINKVCKLMVDHYLFVYVTCCLSVGLYTRHDSQPIINLKLKPSFHTPRYVGGD